MVRARAVATQTGTVILVLIAVYAFLLFLKATGISEVNFDRQQVANGIGVGAIYGSVALALVLIYRSTGVVNFAQGEMAMFSTFFAWSLIVDQKITFWLGFAIVLVLAAILGTVVQ
ncbi:MAG TPA: hypothetical protein VIM74_04355, partial [Casimicrobiaceae bacterium]